MSSNPEDFFVVVEATWNGPDTVYEQHLNTGYLEGLIQRPDQDTSDLDLAIALLDLTATTCCCREPTVSNGSPTPVCASLSERSSGPPPGPATR